MKFEMTPFDPCNRCPVGAPLAGESHPIRFRVLLFDSFARGYKLGWTQVCLEHEAVCGRALARIALPLPRVSIGGERGNWTRQWRRRGARSLEVTKRSQ